MAKIRVTADSGDGLVSATIDGTGALTELYLDPRFHQWHDSTSLATAIVEVVRKATAQAQQEALATAERFLSKDALEALDGMTLEQFKHDVDRALGWG